MIELKVMGNTIMANEERRARVKQLVESGDLGDFLERQLQFSYAEIIDAEAAKMHALEYKRFEEICLNKRRSELDIIASILGMSMNGARKTRIFREVNFSYTVFKKYFSYMVGIQLLKEKKGLFYTTEKGAQFLGHWNQITSLLRL